MIIYSSGMCEAGRVLFHLQRVIEDARSTILITSLQAEGTLGRRLVERRPEVRTFGRSNALRAEVIALGGLSGHADHPGLIEQLRPHSATTHKVRLAPGELEGAAVLAAGLREAGFADVAVPPAGQKRCDLMARRNAGGIIGTVAWVLYAVS